MKSIYILKFTLSFFILFISLSIYSQVHCGTERWDVKTLADPDTTKIDFNQVVASSVHEQVALNAPNIVKDIPRRDDEITVYQIKCRILGFKKEGGAKGDQDIHIVIEDPDTHETMIAELPDAECDNIQKTSRAEQFAELDQWFVDNIGNPTSKYYAMPTPALVIITGVGFFDFNHGQTGRAKNGREIHPVLSMELADASSTVSSEKFVRPNIINTNNSNTMDTPTTPLNTLVLILLGAILGAVGQGIRVIVGLKKVYDEADKKDVPVSDLTEYAQLAMSLFIGFSVGAISGVLAAVSSSNIQFTKSVVIAFITAGYAGTDFIEGFMKKNTIK